MQSTSQPKKNSTSSTSKETPKRVTSADQNDFTQKPSDPDKQNYKGEGDEREWEAPDVKPKYPTDVQASSSNPPAQDEMADYAMSQDEDDSLLGSENPGLMNRH